MAVQLKTNPTKFRSENSCARIVYLQRIGTAQVDRDGGRCVHGKLARQRPDERVDCAAIERKPIVAIAPSN